MLNRVRFRPDLIARSLLCLFAVELFCSMAAAHPYASGVTNHGTTVSWVLNEPADDVQIAFDNGTQIVDLGAAPVTGTNTFAFGQHTNFSITISKGGSYALSQISSDSVADNNFYSPRGVAVNKNPRAANFGRIYVANSASGTAGGRATGRGLYVMDAASGDIFGRGATAATAGAAVGNNATYSPYRVAIGPDDSVFVTDAAATAISAVWMTDPGIFTSTNLFGPANPSTNTAAGGTNFGRCIGTPFVSGSVANGNLALTAAMWDLNLVNPPGAYAAPLVTTNYNSLYQYAPGGGPFPCKAYPTVITNPISIGTVNTVSQDSQVAPDGKYFIAAYRINPADGYTNVCVLDSTGKTVLWDSRTASRTYFGDSSRDHCCLGDFSIAVSPDDRYVLIQGATNNNFLLMSLTNGVPDISTLATNTTVGATGGGTCYASTWDAADNIYVTSGGSKTLRVFSLGLGTTCVTSNDLSGTNGGFQFTINPPPVVSWNAPATISYGTVLDANELNATAIENGVFSYSPPAGTILAPGTNVLTAVFTPSNNAGPSVTNSVSLVVTAPAINVIPWPQNVAVRPGLFTLCPTAPVAALPVRGMVHILVDSGSLPAAQYLEAILAKSTGCHFPIALSSATNAVKNCIVLTTSGANPALGAEGYNLTVAPDGVIINAPAEAGVFYGVQTLLQLLPPQIFSTQQVTNIVWVAPCASIQDQPRFPWRGCMLDVARHFHTVDEVKELLDLMAMQKLNTFHWHLVDDQGWRIQILSYPNLTGAAAYRPTIDYGLNSRASFDYNASGQYGGYYTQQDIRNVVAYAQQRHITIVPEIEMPAHSTAGCLAYPQYACTLGPFSLDTINYHNSLYSLAAPGAEQFLRGILGEVMNLFPGPYLHTGGDEVVAASTIWSTNVPDVNQMNALGIDPTDTPTSLIEYQHWFSTNLANFVTASGRTMVAWSEAETGGILSNVVLMDWETGDSSYAIPAAEAGQKVVTAPDVSCYYNYYQSTNYAVEPAGQTGYLDLSNAYAYDPIPSGLPDAYTNNILGSEGCLWGEYLASLNLVEFRAFPRLCAMAELTWTQPSLKNYTNFVQRVATHEIRLASMGVNFDPTNVTQIGSWSPSVISTSPVTLTWDITSNVVKGGEVNASFWYTTGADGLWIYSATLLENGVMIDQDVHTGFAGDGSSNWVYILRLPERKPGATYTLQASVAGRGGTASSGNVYLPNWY